MTFENLGLHPLIVKALSDIGYTEPTPVQEQSIPLAIKGHDLLVSSKTGSGKTAAFMLPALERFAETVDKQQKPKTDKKKGARTRRVSPKMLVLTPTRELATQIVDAAMQYTAHIRHIKTVAILGGMPYQRQIQLLSLNPDILVATPGRLIDHIHSGRISLSKLQILVLDEADRMLDMGFIEDIETIIEQTPAERQTMLFSATLDGIVGKMAQRITKEPISVHIASSHDKHEQIEQMLNYVDNVTHKDRLLEYWLGEPAIDQALVFTATKRDADIIADRLSSDGFSAAALHGDMPQRARNRTLDKLRKNQIKILVATDVAARGIDIPSITHVINYDLPKFPEDYVHRIGRTGRAGRHGLAISLVGQNDRVSVKRIERFIHQNIPVNTIEGYEPKTSFTKPAKRPSRKQFQRKHSSFGQPDTAGSPSAAKRRGYEQRTQSKRKGTGKGNATRKHEHTQHRSA